MAAKDNEGAETMRDPVDVPRGTMGDGDGGDDGNDDDDDDDGDDDDNDEPEFDWTGLEENVPYVSGACSACCSFYADNLCFLFAPSVFYVMRERSPVSMSKGSLSGFDAKPVASARRSVPLSNRK